MHNVEKQYLRYLLWSKRVIEDFLGFDLALKIGKKRSIDSNFRGNLTNTYVHTHIHPHIHAPLYYSNRPSQHGSWLHFMKVNFKLSRNVLTSCTQDRRCKKYCHHCPVMVLNQRCRLSSEWFHLDDNHLHILDQLRLAGTWRHWKKRANDPPCIWLQSDAVHVRFKYNTVNILSLYHIFSA